MLKEELKKVDCSKDEKFWNVGIILFSPDNDVFYKIAFGDGTNADDLCEDCDDYMYLQTDRYDDDGEFEEDYDGGQMDFVRKNYTGYINDEKLIRNCLEFMECPNPDSCILIRKYRH